MNIKEIKKEALLARICATRQIMGEDAAQSSSRKYQPIIKRKRGNQYSVCSGPLIKTSFWPPCRSMLFPGTGIHALHMDEYIGLQADAPQRFGNYLKEHIFAALPFKSIHYLYIEGASPENICAHYEEVLQKLPSTLFSGKR